MTDERIMIAVGTETDGWIGALARACMFADFVGLLGMGKGPDGPFFIC